MESKELVIYGLDSLKKAGAQKSQCTFSKSEKYEMNVDAGEMSLIRTTYDYRMDFTAINNNKKGSMVMNRVDRHSIQEAVKEVLELAAASEPDPANDISEKQEPEEYNSGSIEPDRELMYERLKEFISDVKAEYPKITVRNVYFDFTRQTTHLLNSNGADLKSSKGIYNFSLIISAQEGDKTSSFNYSGFSTMNLERKLIDCGSIRTLLEQSENQVETKNLAGKFNGSIIITPDCLEGFISTLVDSFLRDASLISGTSIYRNKLNCLIANPKLSLHSKPMSEEIPDGYFITADGYKAQNSTIIDKGVLSSFVLSLYGANKTGTKRAVNSGGAYVVDPGDKSLSEMIRSVDRGLLLCRFSGGRPSQNGDFSGIAKNSYYIEDGKIRYPISETMISGNIASMLQNISDISKERISFGHAVLPWILASDITIIGK